MKFTKPVIAAAALAAALSLTACGSSGTDTTATKAPVATTTAAAAPTSATPPIPTVDELNSKLTTALDPAVPAEQKIALVQGLDADPALLQQLSEKVAQAEADGLVTDIKVVGPLVPLTATSMSVPFTMTINAAPQQGAVDVVVDGGEWKLAKASICNLAGLLEITSEACAA